MTSITPSKAQAAAAEMPQTGPSFATALFGFLGTTTATTMLLFLLGSV